MKERKASANSGVAANKPANIAVNFVSWSNCDKLQNQFMSADDQGFVTVWDALKSKVLARYNTMLSLSTGCIEPSHG